MNCLGGSHEFRNVWTAGFKLLVPITSAKENEITWIGSNHTVPTPKTVGLGQFHLNNTDVTYWGGVKVSVGGIITSS